MLIGVMIQQLIHALLEIWYINLLIKNFNRYSLGLTWADWFIIHNIGSFILLFLGLWFGYKIGKKYEK